MTFHDDLRPGEFPNGPLQFRENLEVLGAELGRARGKRQARETNRDPVVGREDLRFLGIEHGPDLPQALLLPFALPEIRRRARLPLLYVGQAGVERVHLDDEPIDLGRADVEIGAEVAAIGLQAQRRFHRLPGNRVSAFGKVRRELERRGERRQPCLVAQEDLLRGHLLVRDAVRQEGQPAGVPILLGRTGRQDASLLEIFGLVPERVLGPGEQGVRVGEGNRRTLLRIGVLRLLAQFRGQAQDLHVNRGSMGLSIGLRGPSRPVRGVVFLPFGAESGLPQLLLRRGPLIGSEVGSPGRGREGTSL